MLAVLGAACGLRGMAQAMADDAQPTEHGTITVLFENDVFYRTDRDYSNGVQIAWTSPVLTDGDWAVDLADKLPFFSNGSEVRKSYALGQDIFTPSDISVRNPPLTEHPYGGYLYGAVGVMGKSPAASPGDGDRLDQLQLQFGMIGPASLAEETQKFVHALLHDQKPMGWATQLHNEPGLVLTYERSWRYRATVFDGLQVEGAPHIGAAVGNVYDFANAGAEARVGFDLPDDFGPQRVDPSLPGSYYFEPQHAGAFGAYAFAGVDGRAVGRNIFLDGNTWQQSRHVDKNILVGDLQYGAAIAWGAVRLTYTHVFRTKEFKTQMGADQYGALSLSIRY